MVQSIGAVAELEGVGSVATTSEEILVSTGNIDLHLGSVPTIVEVILERDKVEDAVKPLARLVKTSKLSTATTRLLTPNDLHYLD
jgi:hypothetical protein